MTEHGEKILNNLQDIQSLREFLKSGMSISEPSEGGVIAKTTVYNDAPVSYDGGDIVFLGVGLRITVGSESGSSRGSNYWPSRIKKSRPSDNVELRQKYNDGVWFGGTSGSFPAATSDEQAHGDVLFPGERVEYEIKISESDLPSLDIRVEGSVSRRHLLHISRSIEALKRWTQPAVEETFRGLNTIDFYSPLLSIIDSIPAFGPQTTLADINSFKLVVETARDHIGGVMKDLNEVYHSAPSQKLRDYMKKGIGQYLTSATKVCDKTLEALSGSDMDKMKEAAEEMKAHLQTSEELKRGQVDLKSELGL